MRHKTLALLLLVAVSPLVGCIEKDSSTTIYIRNDGTIEWAVLDQNVRSNEDDAGKRFGEERAYIDAILDGTDRLTEGFRTLGGTNLRSVVLRDRAPFATLRSADFEHLNQVWERALKSCDVPHRLELKTDGLVTAWTMAVQIEPEPESPNGCDADAVSAVLSESTDHLRIMLESGRFLSATGFKILSADSVELEEVTGEAIKNGNGVLTFSLTWERKAG